MTDRTRRRIQLAAMLLGVGAALIVTFGGALWIIDFEIGRTAAHGVQERFSLVVLCLLSLYRFSAPRKRTPGRVIADVLLPFVAVMSILWFVRTGTSTPFGYPAIYAYVVAWLGSAGVGIVIARIPARRGRVMA